MAQIRGPEALKKLLLEREKLRILVGLRQEQRQPLRTESLHRQKKTFVQKAEMMALPHQGWKRGHQVAPMRGVLP
eukprot:4954478-Lingulodinium_polyedra.AAC.1